LDFLKRLTGLTWISSYPPGSEIPVVSSDARKFLSSYIGHPRSRFQPDGGNVLATDSEGNALIATHQQGNGQVFYSCDAGLDGTLRALHAFLKLRQVSGTPLTPQRPDRYIFETRRADGGIVYTLAATYPVAGGSDYTVNGPWIKGPENYHVMLGNQSLRLTLGICGLSLFAVRGDGSVDALEGQGTFSIGDHTLLDAQPHIMVASLDEKSLEQSQAVVIFALGAGDISFASAAGLDVIEVGEINGGRFHPIEQIKSSRREGLLTFAIDDVQARGVLLITSSRDKRRAQELLSRMFE
jgi:hypothetical protein